MTLLALLLLHARSARTCAAATILRSDNDSRNNGRRPSHVSFHALHRVPPQPSFEAWQAVKRAPSRVAAQSSRSSRHYLRELRGGDKTWKNIEVPEVTGYGTHYAYIWVGTPPQRQSVIVDTGSFHTAFPCEPCSNCGDYNSYVGSSKKACSLSIIVIFASVALAVFLTMRCRTACIHGMHDDLHRS